jgi:uncharacterized protein VirK/YbjX
VIDGPLMHPGFSWPSLKGKAQLLAACAAHAQELRAWHGSAEAATHPTMIERHPLLPALVDRPYLNSTWSTVDRMRVIRTHYGLLRGNARVLDFPLSGEIELAALDEIEEGLRIVLDKPAWFTHEGEVAINLFIRDVRIYSLLFTLGVAEEGRTVAYVGALQGVSTEALQLLAGIDPLDLYKRLTRTLEGLRPRDFLFAAFRMLCGTLSIGTILAVADRANVPRSGYFSAGKQIFTNHDSTWVEYGGVDGPHGFFEIAVAIPYRDLQTVPSKKRAAYRRRYEILQQVTSTLSVNLEHIARGQPQEAPLK